MPATPPPPAPRRTTCTRPSTNSVRRCPRSRAPRSDMGFNGNDVTQLPARSWLFTPATRPDRFPNAAAAAADVLIVDMEDSVAPADKGIARSTAIDFVPRMAWRAGAAAPSVICALRINALDSVSGLADVQALVASEADPSYLVLPKVDTPGHLQILDRLLSGAGKQARLIAQIETAQGL